MLDQESWVSLDYRYNNKYDVCGIYCLPRFQNLVFSEMIDFVLMMKWLNSYFTSVFPFHRFLTKR